ncbi:Mad28-3 [Candidatus Magnetomoraceae bacterium gMMP-15]
MIFQCVNCKKKLKLDDHRIKDKGTKVRCLVCNHVFTIFPRKVKLKNQSKEFKAASEVSQKPVVIGKVKNQSDDFQGPIGLDIGTSHVVMAQECEKNIKVINQLNAFFAIPATKFSKTILTTNDVTFIEYNNLLYVVGYESEIFANLLNVSTNRPIIKGFLSSKEEEGLIVIQSILNNILEKPKKFNEVITFSVPGNPLDGVETVLFHESILKQYLANMGYSPVAVNEGMATVMSELSDNDFTGIGISMGGGMCNICLSYLAVPVVSFSIQTGGDYIDNMVGNAVNEPATTIKTIKENELDLSLPPKDRIMMAMHIYYDDLIQQLLDSLKKGISAPTFSGSIPIVISGGTAKPKGFKEKFEKALKNYKLPVEISNVRLAEDMLNTTAKGALIKSMTA